MDASSDEIDTDKSLLHQLLTSETRDFLVSPSGDQIKVDELEGKTIGLYFSANWYSQCQSFTPLLANIYNQLKEQGARFEVVFVSSDEDQCAFDNFHGTMPWLAIPFSDLISKKSLTQKFQVEGMPCLIIIDICGKPIQTEGVELIYRYGVQAFPFTQEKIAELEDEEEANRASQTLEKLLSTQTRGHVIKQKEQVPVSTLVGKTVGLYFSALSCLPCEKFTSRLVCVYEYLKEKKEAFEIVFISTDQDEAGYSGCYQSMPWHALPYGDESAKVLLKYFNVKGIPSLIIIGPDGKTITTEGRYLINLHKEMAYPFTEMHLSLLQERLDEEAKSYPRSFLHVGHRHVLNLVCSDSGGGPFICCECDELGLGCAYQCIECGFEVHLKCVREANEDNPEKEHAGNSDPCSS
ncbi:probable nucleoredoxin 2 [Macadamia integrifolia]|uniref:probable nucleoredoxin 2 n=1 Tax=Macadamia integrifolia TaxID=60698 RepID=UPI001C52B85C|nr:probable nucleoredoxin 2 [Macadamia integrifolia]